MIKPFSTELNQCVLALAPAHIANALAPSSFAEVLASHSDHPSAIRVWDGLGDDNIYADARVNQAFRAWHDATHLRLGSPFGWDGELAVVNEQCRDLRIHWPRIPDSIITLLRTDGLDGVAYYRDHASFPIDQRASVLANLGRLTYANFSRFISSLASRCCAIHALGWNE